ncbi:efflux RND transporter periplasmic adaptor subunit [uncultured Oxalicibacterium sp.]|uniref:efflux RND transporter periplasmic adaptor subunit n=1 Tax=uncultured Oxalicibacterium sp. TaxID=1168540 RepID=UPI0025DA83C2|nr:efflux RND transporter periplasmic adaptor subunit [uncultured Oxalicibacterium sp.]
MFVVALTSACGNKKEAGEPLAKSVEIIEVQPRAFTISSELPGRVTPVRVAEVRARVAGIVLKREFEEGVDVKAGDVLFRIDPAPFKAALSRAQGELAKSNAAAFDAEAIAKRYRLLVEIEAVSRQDYDSAEATLKSAQAAQISAQADVETAKLNLEYATVRAPISGRIGRAMVTEGALVGQGEATPLATIQQLDPIFVDFTQSIGDVLQTREALADGRLAKSKDGGAAIKAKVENTNYVREGSLLFSDIGVDQTTNQVTLRGRFPNSDNVLLPGMYVRVQTEQGVDEQAILVPQRAVGRSTDGKPQVLVVNKDNLVEARLVQTGAMHGSEWHIIKGLNAADRVIVGGSAHPTDKVTVQAPKPVATAAAQDSQQPQQKQ